MDMQTARGATRLHKVAGTYHAPPAEETTRPQHRRQRERRARSRPHVVPPRPPRGDTPTERPRHQARHGLLPVPSVTANTTHLLIDCTRPAIRPELFWPYQATLPTVLVRRDHSICRRTRQLSPPNLPANPSPSVITHSTLPPYRCYAFMQICMVNLNHSLSRKSQPKNRERHPNSPQLDARTRKEEGGVYVAYARDSTLIFDF